ncbi:LysE family translocator [Thalassovita taeanensis]|uniref:Threonine/homoserine/homoserine lactone efflux protein n=1 Tax=Thalassovita taeanensis TaxID=657014 RepID=A0A1H9EER5_9RHOB|nr:LysE family translocator [Thalassovita taeanensis]SEQ24256.1 Threonine/homoserine/homoserine lactone efflux protein [Thalassovita taeanensis]
MTLTFLALFLPACFVLNAAPGPNNLLAFSNASRLGVWPALIGGTGRLPAFATMIALVALGLGALLAASETAFSLVKYAGAAYLAYVGLKLWRAPAPTGDAPVVTDNRMGTLIKHDFLIAVGNPKAIAIFTAFFPQFVDFTAPVGPQFATLGALFLALELLAMALYAGLGRAMASVLTPLRLHRLNKGVGGFLIFSGLAMALNPRH